MAAVAGGIITFIAGWLLYGMVLADFFAANAGSATGVTKDPPVLWAMFAGNTVMSLLLAVIFEKWAGIKTLAAGAQAGALVGVLVALGIDLMIYATSNLMNLTGTCADVVVSTLMATISGAAVGWVLGR